MSSRTHLRAAIAAVSILSFNVAALASDLELLARSAQSAWFAGNVEALKKLAADNASLAKSADPRELYTVGYVHFRLMQTALGAKRNKDAEAAGQACTAAFDAATKADPRLAEAFALQSACYGYAANLGGTFAAIRNGRASGRAMDSALAIDPKNPRVVLVDALNLYFRPKIAGGDKEKGCGRFRDAVAAFDGPAAAKPAPAGIAWGAAEAHYWVGRCAADAGDAAGARRAFERAVALAPDFAAARKRL